ncbi:MAG TPA: hypothetical protein VK474_13390 [Chthoniobacterales bacterium]|nr:hypothetical protein [Chthoniobacterales bacterium]
MAKILLSLSVLFLTLSAVFGVLNTNKARALRRVADKADSPRPAEQANIRQAKEKALATQEANLAATTAQKSQAESKLGSAETELIKTQSEKTALQAKLQANQAEIAELRRRLESSGSSETLPDALPMPGAGDLQTQLEETRRQLDTAEREKQLLADRIKTTQDRPSAPAPGKRATVTRPPHPNVRGTVLAVNEAYNFVVLNLGGRQGIEADSEMLVLRRGALIGKIRVSSVEPATAIGDIVTTSLARGVQVQPGDVVIYAGPNS